MYTNSEFIRKRLGLYGLTSEQRTLYVEDTLGQCTPYSGVVLSGVLQHCSLRTLERHLLKYIQCIQIYAIKRALR